MDLLCMNSVVKGIRFAHVSVLLGISLLSSTVREVSESLAGSITSGTEQLSCGARIVADTCTGGGGVCLFVIHVKPQLCTSGRRFYVKVED